VGKYYRVRGPLNIPRPIQGHPVIAQAGASDPGQELAARTADVVYTAQQQLEPAKAFYSGLKARMEKYGRDPDELIVMPGLLALTGKTDAEAQSRLEQLQELLHPITGLNSIAQAFGDLSGYDLDGPVPEHITEETNKTQSTKKMWLERVRRENLTIRQRYQLFSISAGHQVVVGSPTTIADKMEEWFTAGACDGMNITCWNMPQAIFDFVDLVVPELQRRGLARTEYQGATLRENLGLKRPENRYTTPESVAR
jgi:FMN-dependent oxidoreductase (nitrilotriacetate monooxygenase family)